MTDPGNSVTGLFQGTSGDALKRVESALEHASHSTTPPPVALQLDREAIETLRGSAAGGQALEALALDRIANLLDRCTGRHDSALAMDQATRRVSWDALDLVRRSVVLRRVAATDVGAWSDRILALVDASQLTLGPLFRQRAEIYGSKPLFEIPRTGAGQVLSWRQTASRVEFLARSLLSLDSSDQPAPIAILSENRIEMALVDLACLTSGLVNVMVPANATEADVGYMLRHSRAGAVIVSNALQLRKVLHNRESLPDLRRIITLEAEAGGGPDTLTLDELTSRALHIPGSLVVSRSESVRADDLATIMYTSGTTGAPKAIAFSQRNLVFKRFARALALPEIGEEDRFLCFLPLFHTFGRFLEMLGCVFWGATYCFLEGTSAESLVRGMRRERPTVFISVPKKWTQIYDEISRRADPMTASDDELARATRDVTGGRLRWGLSAAGYLDPDIFRFFQNQGVSLLSGFGMTEATGGITMTPPGDYHDDSLGAPLPGIEVALADDGELLIRGPYVMIGYHEPPDAEPSYDEQGWLHSGDLMELDPNGHLRLVDRKKEIYKNVRGETIAPQRVENHFRDFESVGRAFLVGDHREYNTLLIYPRPDYDEIDFSSLSDEERWNHFRSLVISVNKFLAPYERIVDFAVIDRDLDPERGELTPKGTPRRRTVVNNFADVIRNLYRRAELHVGGIELTFPNWLFQALGLTVQDIRVGEDRLFLPSSGRSLSVRRESEELLRIGSALYRARQGPVDLGKMLTTPSLWLGNRELVDFVPLETAARYRPGRATPGVQWNGSPDPYHAGEDEPEKLRTALVGDGPGLMDLDLAARVLESDNLRCSGLALKVIRKILDGGEGPLTEPARLVLGRAGTSPSTTTRRRAFEVLAPAEKESRFPETLRRFIDGAPALLEPETRARIVEHRLPRSKIEAFINVTAGACRGADDDPPDERLAPPLLWFLSEYGAAHPASYRRLRAFLTRMRLLAPVPAIREEAARSVESLEQGFRTWLGPNSRIAVDAETGQEYRWSEVVVFEDALPVEHRNRILDTIENTAMLREAVFLFSKGSLIRLSDIPPGGVWIRLLGSREDKSVYRVNIHTRFNEAHDLAININDTQIADQVREEIDWLLLSGDAGDRDPLVEDFGGYWPDQDLWTEEFISGETLDRVMLRLSRRDDRGERLRQLWPFMVHSTLVAYVDFWDRTGRRWEIADPSLSNVVVPTQDFQTGSRIVSLSARKRHSGLLSMMVAFQERSLDPAESQHPVIAGLARRETMFAALLDVVGESEGIGLLEQALGDRDAEAPAELLEAVQAYVAETRGRGFVPMRLRFAAERYRRWEKLNTDPTPRARGRTLQELYETYGLHRLNRAYPESRVRFFRDTVFRDAPSALALGLDEMILSLRKRELSLEHLIDAVSDLRATVDLDDEAEYFLTRVSLPHLRPDDRAGFVSSYLGGKQQSEIVVGLEDHEGRSYRVRHALNPKEVERLHRLFLSAKLDVRFRLEHQYLIAINERGQIVAGIYYETDEDGSSAHLEKIVVSESYRRKGVADGLMEEFFNRLRAAGVKTVTTGFFRPEYFYAHGFRIEKRYAGLVKALEE